MNALPSVMSRRPETGIDTVPWAGSASWAGRAPWAEELSGAAWVFPDRVSRGLPGFRARREFWAGRASGAGSVSRASAPCGLSVIVVIREFLSCSAWNRARQKKRRGGYMRTPAAARGNEHRGEIEKQRRRPDRCEMPCARTRSYLADGAEWQMLAGRRENPRLRPTIQHNTGRRPDHPAAALRRRCLRCPGPAIPGTMRDRPAAGASLCEH